MILFDPRSGEYVTFDPKACRAERPRVGAVPIRSRGREVGFRPTPQPPVVADQTPPERAAEPPFATSHADAVAGASLSIADVRTGPPVQGSSS
jgi:hypothetical protein